MVRQITCWTLARYSEWAASLTDSASKEQFFVPMMDGILRKMLDKNKRVQEAAASAFANLEEKAGKNLKPYCGPIVQQFVRCFGKYKDRNIQALYYCVQILAERLGNFLAAPELGSALMSAVIERYNKVGDQSREVFPLFECLSYITLALGDSFSPYAPTVFTRCVNIISSNLEQTLAAMSNPALDPPNKDFLITSLDLLSAIVQSLDAAKSLELVTSTQHSFFELLSFCMEDPTDEVRQSSYALLGDSAKYVYPELKGHLGTLLPTLITQLDLDSILDEDIESGYGVVNNACWSVGEIALHHGKEMSPHIADLVQKLVDIMCNPGVPRGICENAAVAIGRLGIGNAEKIAPVVGNFAEDFLSCMNDIDPTEEKATAMKGFTMTVAQNPQSIENVVNEYFVAIARFKASEIPSPLKEELHEVFQQVSRLRVLSRLSHLTDKNGQILNVYKQLMPQFGDFIGKMRAQDQEALKASYSI